MPVMTSKGNCELLFSKEAVSSCISIMSNEVSLCSTQGKLLKDVLSSIEIDG